jgi:hypothetical protein
MLYADKEKSKSSKILIYSALHWVISVLLNFAFLALEGRSMGRAATSGDAFRFRVVLTFFSLFFLVSFFYKNRHYIFPAKAGIFIVWLLVWGAGITAIVLRWPLYVIIPPHILSFFLFKDFAEVCGDYSDVE